MTWRERIAAARERGEFTNQDRRDMRDCATCFFGEVITGLGMRTHERPAIDWSDDDVLDPLVFTVALAAVNLDDFDMAEETLEAIEDRVLQLKRGEA